MSYRCSNPWTTFFVWGNGEVTHCCYSSWGTLGNVNRDSLEAIWRGPRWEALRQRMAKGDLPGAGCEPWCRVVRWDRHHGHLDAPPPIPEGLGRIEDGTQPPMPDTPPIVGLATPWICDLHCTHCLSSRRAPGLTKSSLARIWPWAEKAEILRLMDGEFSINPESLRLLRNIGAMARQPRIFLNTHAQTPLEHWWDSVKDLRAFHLKCSLEGVEQDYERVRRGGSWLRFASHVGSLRQRFGTAASTGRDWKLFLNACVMSGNLEAVPDLVRFAVRMDLPLVLNILHGMRHLDENFGAYEHLRWGPERVEALRARTEAELRTDSYAHSGDVRLHLDHVLRVLSDPRKVRLPRLARMWLSRRPGLATDRILGFWLRWKWSRRGACLSIARKIRKRLTGGHG